MVIMTTGAMMMTMGLTAVHRVGLLITTIPRSSAAREDPLRGLRFHRARAEAALARMAGRSDLN